MTLNVHIERTPGLWHAVTEDCEIGVVSSKGTTRDEVIESFKEALRFGLDFYKEKNGEAPTYDQIEFRELVAV
jgi:predicted RNase H-like HicB family nuclease